MVDKQTPTGGERMDSVSPHVWVGHYGQPQELSYTDTGIDTEQAGSGEGAHRKRY